MQEKEKVVADDVRLVETPDPCPESNEEPVGLRIGAHVGEFVIEELLGRGGVSEVYRARDTRTDTSVAIKFLLPSRLSDKQSCARLRGEAKHIMELRHRNIVAVTDVRENDATGPYIVMELIEGKPLTEHLPLSPSRSLDLCSHVAEALAYAHSKGMIHRDIKPSNIMVLSDGSIKLVDFGLAKIFAQENPQHIPLTRTSEVVGTPLYMSPEQCFGQDVDARSDVYQLGCLLYQCVTGLPPFEGSTSFEAMYKHVSAQPDLQRMPDAVRAILTQALDKNPDARFQSASEMAFALREAMQGRVKSRKPAKSFLRRVGVGAGIGVAIGVVIIAQMALLNVGKDPFKQWQAPSGPLTPTQAEAQRYYEDGLDWKAKGWTEKSREALTKAIQLDKGVIGFKALSFLRSHLPAHSVSVEAEQLNIKGFNLSYSGQEKEAETVWLQCIEQYPDFEWAYSNLGDLYNQQGHPDKALPFLQKAIEINPFYTNALLHMCDTQVALGHKDLAMKYAKSAAESDPDNAQLQKVVERMEKKF